MKKVFLVLTSALTFVACTTPSKMAANTSSENRKPAQTGEVGAQVLGADLDGSNKYLLVNVRHGGGCGNHDYSLKILTCREISPVQCDAIIVHKSSDPYEAILSKTAVINLESSGLNTDYYNGATITIISADNKKISVDLPDTKTRRSLTPAINPTPAAPARNQISCVTHTGSTLVISDGRVSLTTTDGDRASYGITNVRSLSLESMPPVAQNTYKLDDGRSIVTAFRGIEKTGTGNFIRLDGKYSPEFECKR